MTYEYVCTACGHEWEADHAISAPPLKDCPSCHKATAKRQVSGGTGFVLKGGGWYSDLYSSSKPPAKDTGESSSSKSSKESGSSKASDGGGSNDSGSKDTGSKDTASKDSASKSSGSSSKSGSSSTSKPASD